MLVGADRRDMHHPRAMRRRGQRHLLRAVALHGVEPLPAALEQDAHQVDHDVGAAHRRRHRFGVPDIGLHRMDLADPAERLQVAGEVRPPHRDADAVVAAGQRPDQMAAEEAGTAKHRDQRVVVRLQGHEGSLRAAVFGPGRRFIANCAWFSPLQRAASRHKFVPGCPRNSALALDPAIPSIDKTDAENICVGPSPDGGIGRRTSFRYWRREAWRFESSSGHHQVGDLSQFSAFSSSRVSPASPSSPPWAERSAAARNFFVRRQGAAWSGRHRWRSADRVSHCAGTDHCR